MIITSSDEIYKRKSFHVKCLDVNILSVLYFFSLNPVKLVYKSGLFGVTHLLINRKSILIIIPCISLNKVDLILIL